MRPLRVVIVEDEALPAMLLQGFLEDAGHQVLGWVTTSTEANRLVGDTNPDLVFVDLHLADGLTGVNLGQRLHETSRPFVFVTANTRMLPSDYAGALGVISKPYSVSGIRRALEYIEQGLRSPPPRCARPSSLMLAPSLAKSWP